MSQPFQALVKLAFVIIATVGIHVGFTAPQPPPPASERKPASSPLEFVLSSLWVPTIAKTVSWFIAVQEAYLVLSLLSSSPSQAVASNQKNITFTTQFLLGTSLAFAGGFTRWLCYRALGRHFTFQMSIKKSHKLITEGPYAVVRHPAYTGYFMTVFGTTIWYGSQGSWIRTQLATYSFPGILSLITISLISTSIVSGMLTRLPVEDSTLQQYFGTEWEEWADRVRWKLIPGIY